MEACIFCNMSQGQTDADLLFRDDRCFVIRDINRMAPTHLLVIPHQHMTSLAHIDPDQESLIGHLFAVAEEMARQEQVIVSGFRLVINQGPDAGQSITHVHLHLLGGKPLPAPG